MLAWEHWARVEEGLQDSSLQGQYSLDGIRLWVVTVESHFYFNKESWHSRSFA